MEHLAGTACSGPGERCETATLPYNTHFDACRRNSSSMRLWALSLRIGACRRSSLASETEEEARAVCRCAEALARAAAPLPVRDLCRAVQAEDRPATQY